MAQNSKPPFAGQIALPLSQPGRGTRIVPGNAIAAVVEACQNFENWPFHTAMLWGEPRSGKSLIARWFTQSGLGDAIDDARAWEEDAIFHHWNRAQATGRPLLIVGPPVPNVWAVKLPDLGSRLGAALNLSITAPDDAMIAGLIEAHAEARGLVLPAGATTYLVPRSPRSFAGIEALVAEIDRLSLERKQPATLAIWREALTRTGGDGGEAEQGELL